MLKRTMMAVILLSVSVIGYSQDSTQGKRSHYLSLQANPLISQIFNFGNPIPISNPYLIKYSYQFANGKSGLSTGFGYQGSTTKNEKEGFENKFSTFDFRAGYEWYIPMSKRFLLSVGPDLTFNGTNSKRVSSSAFGSGSFSDSTVSDSYSQGLSYGGGARLNFSVAITSQIIIGTEATLYYSITESKSTTQIERFVFSGNNQSYSYEKIKNEENGSNTRIQLPVAIFLTIRF